MSGAQGASWGPAPLTPWYFNHSLNNVDSGLLPSLKPFESFKDVLEEVGENKVSTVKVKKTQPFIFPAEMEGPPEGKDEPSYTMSYQIS